jgi:hypothetical protein
VPVLAQFVIGIEGADEPISRHWRGMMMPVCADRAVVRLIDESRSGERRAMYATNPAEARVETVFKK